MDPNKRISWVVTGVVAAGIGVMVLYALYRDYRDGAGPFARAPTESARDPAAHSQDVLKVRVLAAHVVEARRLREREQFA